MQADRPTPPHVELVDGDLLDQPVEAIVNAWNRNVLPWWLLLPQGVSGAIKRRGGTAPFRELARLGPMPLGSARYTSAGKLPYRGIIHVAGIDLLWRASRASIAGSVRSALEVAEAQGLTSLAFPLIGAGSGSFDEGGSLSVMLETFAEVPTKASVRLVRYRR